MSLFKKQVPLNEELFDFMENGVQILVRQYGRDAVATALEDRADDPAPTTPFRTLFLMEQTCKVAVMTDQQGSRV